MLSANYRKRLILIGIFLVVIFLPLIVTSQHMMHILILAGLESIVVMGFIAQYNVRLLSFCTSSYWGLGAYASAVLATYFKIDFWFSLLLAGLVTGFFAFIIGLLVIRAGWGTFLMISLVIGEVFVEVVGNTNLLGGWSGFSGIPPPAIGSYVFLSKVPYYYLTIVLIMVCILIFIGFYKSAVGKAWTAIGQSSDLAESVGINIFKYRMITYVTAAFTAGMSGSLYAHYYCFLVPQTFGTFRSLYVTISGVVGGLQFVISGPIIGSIIIKTVPEWFRITDKFEPIFEGVLMILCCLFFRKGIMGTLSKYITRSK
jgi:branched-chain amino acid transport system permease protein